MTDVVVVGAGPTGLLTAIGLARRGVGVEVVDRRTRPEVTTRALSVWGRACDILEQHGISRAQLEAESVPVRRLRYFDARAHVATFGLPESAPCRTLPQQRTEALLVDRLAELGVEVTRGTELVDMRQSAHGVELDIYGPSGPRMVNARFVVGADGAHSTVRRCLGIDFDGETVERRFAVVDAHLAAGTLEPDACLFYQSPTGPLVVVPIGDGVFRFLGSNPDGGPDALGEVVAERGPAGVRIGRVVSSAVFTVHAREASSYRRERVFLVGDAAHIHSPAGGQGMNNGLQDAHNLSWKLASVVLDGAPIDVLDTYESERRPATQRIIADTSRQMRLWMLQSRSKIMMRNIGFRVAALSGLASRRYAPVMAGYRVRYPTTSAVHRRCAGARGVGYLGRGSLQDGWSIGAADPVAISAALGTMADVVPVVPDDGECRGGGFSLVRPDGHVQMHGHAGDSAVLLDELRRWGMGAGAASISVDQVGSAPARSSLCRLRSRM